MKRNRDPSQVGNSPQSAKRKRVTQDAREKCVLYNMPFVRSLLPSSQPRENMDTSSGRDIVAAGHNEAVTGTYPHLRNAMNTLRGLKATDLKDMGIDPSACTVPTTVADYDKIGLNDPDKLTQVLKHLWSHHAKNPKRIGDRFDFNPGTFRKIVRLFGNAASTLSGTLRRPKGDDWHLYTNYWNTFKKEITALVKRKNNKAQRPGCPLTTGETATMFGNRYQGKIPLPQWMNQRGVSISGIVAALRKVQLERARDNGVDTTTHAKNRDPVYNKLCPIAVTIYKKAKPRGGRNLTEPDCDFESGFWCTCCKKTGHRHLNLSKLVLTKQGFLDDFDSVDLEALACLYNIWLYFQWQQTGPYRHPKMRPKLIHSWGTDAGRFNEKPIAPINLVALMDRYAKTCGIERELSFQFKDCRPTFVQQTLGDLKTHKPSIRAVTGHNTDQCLEADYYDSALVVDVNKRWIAQYELLRYTQGLIQKPPDSVVALYAEVVSFQKRILAKTEAIASDLTVVRTNTQIQAEELVALRQEVADCKETIATQTTTIAAQTTRLASVETQLTTMNQILMKVLAKLL